MRDELAALASRIAREAGARLRAVFRQRVDVTPKGAFDIVTDVDRVVDTLIVERLRSARPHDQVVSEERGPTRVTDDLCWYVDPLDGTKNFARGFPSFAVSLAVADRHGPCIGVVYDPLRDELFQAVRDGGATCNGLPLRVADTTELRHCLLATGVPSAARHTAEPLGPLMSVSRRVLGVRRTGSSALDLAYVAAGYVDAFWDLGLAPWDVAAGVLLVSEAGGRVSTTAGCPFALDAPDTLACASGVHEDLVHALSALR